MVIIPQNKIRILKDTKLVNDYKHTYSFNSVNEQYNFFISKKFMTIDEVTAIDSGNLEIEINYLQLLNCDYIMFQNTDSGDKWFYAFINDVTYINDETCSISYEIDVLQTYMFDYSLAESQIIRETVEDDTIGLHTIEESLNFGETLRNEFKTYQPTTFLLQIYVTEITDEVTQFAQQGQLQIATPQFLNGAIPVYYILRLINQAILYDVFKSYEGIPESVITIFMMPNADGTGYVENPSKGYQLRTPKNNKLRVYPYSYVVVDTGTSSKIFHNELFNDNRFYIDNSDLQDIPTIIYPVNYNGLTKNLTDSVFLETNGYKIPWKGSALQSWLNQNIGNIAVTTVGSFGSIAGGLATGNLLMAGGGVASAGSLLSQGFSQTRKPDSVQGNFVPVSSIYHGVCKTIFYNSYLKSEYLDIIDDYFSMYGYRVNTFKIPNIKSRTYWNYIETFNVNVKTSLPSIIVNEIKSAYNNGITFWHTSDILNYSLTNSIK